MEEPESYKGNAYIYLEKESISWIVPFRLERFNGTRVESSKDTFLEDIKEDQDFLKKKGPEEGSYCFIPYSILRIHTK